MRRANLLALATLALGAALDTPAWAHLDASSRYTSRSCPATVESRVDPINVVFHTWGTWGRVASQVESHAGWRSTSGSTQFFSDHGGCYEAHAQRASGEGSRFHVRVRGQHPATSLAWAATGDAHHEDLVVFPVPCGHAVDANGPEGSGFDQGRKELRGRLAAAGHTASLVWWGNTRSFKQCDGDYAASDGWVLYVSVHQVNH